MTDAGPSRTVLIAEDTPFVRDRFKSALEREGHRAVTVKSAAELLVHVRTDLDQIHLILLNLKLSGQPGLQIVRSIRKMDAGRLPILVFSGTVGNSEEVKELARLGVAGYVNEYSAVQHIVPSLNPHLMPENVNRRKSPRVVLGIPISCRTGRTVAAALTLTIGRGGLSIGTSNPLPPETVVHLRFRLPGSQKDIDADASVRWADKHVGMGLQFERVDPADQAAIDDFVNAHFFKPRATT